VAARVEGLAAENLNLNILSQHYPSPINPLLGSLVHKKSNEKGGCTYRSSHNAAARLPKSAVRLGAKFFIYVCQEAVMTCEERYT
jgi:hypothetical protein